MIPEEIKDILQERISEEPTIDGLASRVMKEVVEVVPLFLEDSIQQRTAEDIVAQIQERMVQVGNVIPQERPFDQEMFFSSQFEVLFQVALAELSLNRWVSTLFRMESGTRSGSSCSSECGRDRESRNLTITM